MKAKVKSFLCKYHWPIILFIVLAAVLLSFFCLVPKDSFIYYEGYVKELELEVETKIFQTRVSDDGFNGKIIFSDDPDLTKNITAINMDLMLNSSREDLDLSAFEDEQVFHFNNGVATLNSANYLELTMKMPNDNSFTYSLTIRHEQTDVGTDKKNYVTISDFPEETIITIRSASQINMAGNITEHKMQSGVYKIEGCNTISFFLDPPAQKSTESINERSYDLFGEINSFQVMNHERQSFEFTVDATTEFREIGHIELSGRAKTDNSLSFSILDMGEYPILLMLSGDVGELKIAGNSLYLTIQQWLRMNMTQILLALISVVFSAIIVRPSNSKPSSSDD